MTDNTSTLQELKQLVQNFVTERDWSKYHDAKNLAMSISIEAAELQEHFQWVRNDEIDQVVSDKEIRREIEDELADILAFVLSFANSLNIDLSEALKRKMIHNEKKYPADEFRSRYKKPKG